MITKEHKMTNFAFVIMEADPIKKIEELLKHRPASLVIIDGFADLFTGDLNMATDTRGYMQKFNVLIGKYDCSILFIHHTTKAAEIRNTYKKGDLLGSQALEAKARSVIMFSKHDHDYSRRILQIVKGNYVTEEFKKQQIHLKFDPVTLTFERLTITENDDYDYIKTRKKVFSTKQKRRGRKTDYSKVAKAKVMYKEGKTQQEITKYFRVNKSTISRWLKLKIPPGYNPEDVYAT